MANVIVCEGVAGPVLEVTAKHRKGEENFVSCMRKAMAKKYGDKPVAMGGVFLIEKGQVKVHIMVRCVCLCVCVFKYIPF